MASGTEVLREYLLSLGFKVDATEKRKFDKGLETTGKFAVSAGGALVGVATAAVAMVTVFSNQMEKLYYASRRSNSTVANLQAMDFGARNIGLSGDQMRSSIESMARALRTSPGLVGVLKSFGVKVEGRDMSDVAMDAVRAFRQMPFYVGSRFANMFGMDGDTFLMLSQGLEQLDEAAGKRRKMAADAGVDADAAAAAAVRYQNIIRSTTEKVGLLKDALSIALLPTMEALAVQADAVLTKITRAIAVGEYRKALGEALTMGHGDAPFPKFDWRKPLAGIPGGSSLDGVADRIADAIRGYGHPGGSAYGRAQRVGLGRGFVNPALASSGGQPAPGADKGVAAIAQRVEEKYGLPDGVLIAMMQQESGGNPNAVSPTGVRGLMQITGVNRKRLGIGFDAEGQMDGAGRMMAEGLERYKGDLSKALTYYNAGTDRDKLGTAEARNYAPSVVRRMEQHNTYHIAGTGAPEIAEAVAQKLESSNGNLLRDLEGVTR